jgi:Transcriptional regulator SbtR-like, C-terminal domain
MIVMPRPSASSSEIRANAAPRRAARAVRAGCRPRRPRRHGGDRRPPGAQLCLDERDVRELHVYRRLARSGLGVRHLLGDQPVWRAELSQQYRGSLYRRYGSKADLLQHLCLLAMEQSADAAEAGLAAEDAWSGLVGNVHACVGFGSGALATLAGTIESTPRMWETSRRGRRLLDELVTRAREQGGLRADVTALDITWLIELFGRQGPDWPGTGDSSVRDRLLAIAVPGLRADARVEPLPAPPPSPARYEQRWRARG